MNDLICPTGGEIDNLDGFVKEAFLALKNSLPFCPFGGLFAIKRCPGGEAMRKTRLPLATSKS